MTIEEFSANTETAMKALISNCKNAQIEYAQFFSGSTSIGNWMSDFCTVKSKSSRRTGQTLSAIKIMMDTMWFDNAILIDANQLAADHQRKNAEASLKRQLPKDKFMGVTSFLHNSVGRYSGQCDGLFIDAGNVLHKAGLLDEIYQAMLSNVSARHFRGETFCFVLFG